MRLDAENGSPAEERSIYYPRAHQWLHESSERDGTEPWGLVFGRLTRAVGLSRWEALVLVGVVGTAVVAALPACWAYLETRSMNAVIIVTTHVDSLAVASSIAPMLLFQAPLAVAILCLLLIAVIGVTRRVRPGPKFATLPTAILLTVYAMTAGLALWVLGRGIPYSSAESISGLVTLGLLVLPTASFGVVRRVSGIRRLLASWGIGFAIVWILVIGTGLLAYGAAPAPRVQLTFGDSPSTVGYLLGSKDGVTWFLEEQAGGDLIARATTRQVTDIVPCGDLAQDRGVCDAP